MLSPESSEETIDDRDRRDFERNHPTQDSGWEGPSHPPSVASGSGHNSPGPDDMHRLALTGPVAYGEYYEKWPDAEPDDDEPGFTQPAREDPPTPTQTEVPLEGDGQVVVRSSQPVFRKPLTKEDTLMSIDFSQSRDDSTCKCCDFFLEHCRFVADYVWDWLLCAGPANDTALEEKLAAMFDLMRQKQREDMELAVQNIKSHLTLEYTDLKNEVMKLRTELVDMRLQYHRMQNAR